MELSFLKAERRNMPTFSKAVLVIVCLFSSFIYAQSLDNDTFNNQPKWRLSFYVAAALGGPRNQIENTMRASGFNDNQYDWLFSGEYISYPQSTVRGIPWMIETEYRINRLFSLGFQISNSVIRETVGFTKEGFGDLLSLNYSAQLYALTVSFYLNENIIFGIGPSLNTLIMKEIAEVKKNKLGLTTYLNFKVPISGFITGNLIFQYRYTGSIDIGPFVKESGFEFANITPSLVKTTFPQTKIDYNHWFIGFGTSFNF